MPDSSNSIDDDDIAAKLMPNVAKLIRAESDSLELNGSTSMSLCETGRKDKIETRNARPTRQRPGESVFRDVANKFLRRGAIGKRSVGACKPSTWDTLSSHYSSSAERKNAYVFEKDNFRPKATTLVKQGTLPILQQKMAMRDTSQKAARKFRKIPSRSVVKLGQRRTVNPKIQGAHKSSTVMVPEHLAQHAATVTLPKTSQSSQGSEGSRYFSNLAPKSQRGKGKLYMKTMPLNLSELQEEFAKIDDESLEEEEVSIAHLTTTRLVLASETILQHADDIPENVVENRKDLSRCGREDEVSATLNPKTDESTLPNYSHGQGQGGVGICTSQSKLSKTPGRDQDVQVSEPACEANVAASSGHNSNAITHPERQPSPFGNLTLDDPRVTVSNAFFSSQGSERSSQFSRKVAAQQQLKVKRHRKPTPLEINEQQNMCAQISEVDIGMKEGWSVHPTFTKPILLPGVVSQHADGDERDNVKCRNEENPPRFEQDSASPSVNGMEDEARTADTKIPPFQLDASAQELSGKGTSVCNVVLELEHAEVYSSSKPKVDNFKVLTADGPDANTAYREDTVPGHTSTFRGDVQSAPSKVKRLLEQEDVIGIPLQEGTYSTGDTSATPPRNPLLLTCLHYSRRGRSIDMSQRRLVFDSASESLSRQKVMDSNSNDVSASTVEFRGRTDPATDILNPDVHEFDANMTSIPHQETKVPFTDDEVTCYVDDMDCISRSSKPKAATHCEGVVDTRTPLTGSLAQDGTPPVLEASTGVVGKDPGIDSLTSPQAEPATACLKTRGLGKRTWANLGAPIDGGTEWKEGRRVSTRIKSRPLDWWRGERMLYGRVHSTLCTLIGIKTTSPDPIWPRPKPQRGDYNIRNFHVDSFVDDTHCDLLRLAAQ